MLRLVLSSVALGAASLAVVDPAPSYDPWAWLLWGRELSGAALSTAEGPALKPLPVIVCAALAPFGTAAPWLWVLVARAAAVLAVALAFRLGRRLAGNRLAGGLLAATAVALTGRFLSYSASGLAEGMLLAFALAAVESRRRGAPRATIALAAACALLRVETWPFLLVAGAAAWRASPENRRLIAAAGLLVPLAWFMPDLLSTGDLWRSGTRARIPNPGQPALADVPALASLHAAAGLPPWPSWIGVAGLLVLAARAALGRAAAAGGASARVALVPALVGAAWVVIVAAMAEAGFSGEPRYALPGAALIAVSGAAGLTRMAAAVPSRAMGNALLAILCVAVVAPSASRVADIAPAQAYQWRLAGDLARAIRLAGGREAVLACGTPYVGRLRGPLLAYRLQVHKRGVEPDRPPRAPGVVFGSSLTARARPAPDVPAGFARIARTGSWDVFAQCR